MKKCSQCGNSYPDDKSACPKCGSSKIESPVSETKKQVNERMYD